MCDYFPDDVHAWFGLTYSNYLVMNRTLLQSMPDEWQHKFVALLEDLEERVAANDIATAPQFDVRVRTFEGRYARDPIPHYDRGRARVCLDLDRSTPR